MKIAVFGAAGWAGRAVINNLASRHQVRAVDLNRAAWKEWEDIDGAWSGGEIVDADIRDYAATEQAILGMDAVIHLTVCFPPPEETEFVKDPNPFLINLKGLWNVIHASHKHGIRRIVHLGSSPVAHRDGVFFSADVRRPGFDLYAATKRLQEEMCLHAHEGLGLNIIVLRAEYIVDSRLGIGRYREKLGPEAGHPATPGWVCRHDLAEACRLAAELDSPSFDALHITGMREADQTCNAAHARAVLGLEYSGDLEKYR
jgi:nucleoside-diphosphate-sugar epimerase